MEKPNKVKKKTKVPTKATKVVKPLERNEFAKESFPEVLRKNLGIVTKACKELEISADAYYDWRRSDPDFAAECDKAQEYVGDFVESKLYELVEEKNPAVVMFYCKTKLKNRGFVERKEIESTITMTHEEAIKNLE